MICDLLMYQLIFSYEANKCVNALVRRGPVLDQAVARCVF